ncbi:hypothetical protein ACFL42_05120, partial [Candidatus Omnitrophota bacterium]
LDFADGKQVKVRAEEDGRITVNGSDSGFRKGARLMDIVRAHSAELGLPSLSVEGLPYELSYTVMDTGEIRYSHKAQIVFDPLGRIHLMNCTDKVRADDRPVFRGHTHPGYVEDIYKGVADEEYMRYAGDVLALEARGELWNRYDIPEDGSEDPEAQRSRDVRQVSDSEGRRRAR